MNVTKAYEITDAKIKFVSLVDKAANLKKFLITKAEAGEAAFTTCGRIVKADAENHFVTGIVYEPLTEDAHGNFMTEEEITKAAYFFAKNGGDVDLQHSFEPLDGAEVVESWIAKADFQIGDETVQKGTWLMTMEIDNKQIWDAIEKGDITGFSMGGVGVYSEEDTKLEDVAKNVSGSEPEKEKKGVFKKLAAMMGFDVVEKGALADFYAEKQRVNNFWTAFYALQDMLCYWDSWNGKDVLETDEAKVKAALADFTSIVEGILTSDEPVTKQLAAADQPVVKAGKKMSGANRETLQTAYDALGALLEAVAEPNPEDKAKDKTEDKTTDTADDKSKADTGADNGDETPPKNEPKPDEGEDNKDKDKEEKDLTKAEVEKLVQDTVAEAITKAIGEQQPEQQPSEAVTAEMVQEMVQKAVSAAIEPVLKARGVPSAMNDGTGEQPVEKHYLHGIL
nr:MAG TPA: serine protease [Caudoviricetes sp.]